jgi:hypothetical protein
MSLKLGGGGGPVSDLGPPAEEEQGIMYTPRGCKVPEAGHEIPCVSPVCTCVEKASDCLGRAERKGPRASTYY